MDGDPRPAPPVTVSSPPGAAQRAGELLTGAPERPPRLGGAFRRSPAQACLAAAALAIAGAGIAAADDQRRDAGVVRLTLLSDTLLSDDAQGAGDGRDGPPVVAPTGGTAVVRYRAEVRNDGPRTVTVVGAELGGYRSSDQPRALRPGAQLVLTLSRVVRCVDPPAGGGPGALQVDVTTDGGPGTARLPVRPGLRSDLDRAADRACGVVPLDEVLALRTTSAQQRGNTAVVGLEATNLSARPLRLTRVDVQYGLRGALRDAAGVALVLPLDLPPASPGQRRAGVSFVLEVRIVGCEVIDQFSPPADEPPFGTVSVTVDRGAGTAFEPLPLGLADQGLRDLVDRNC